MNWIEVSKQTPPIGIQVEVVTIYEYEDISTWNGKEWVNNEGAFMGDKKEVSHWKLPTS
jgi:hypothetical protein